MLNVFVLTWALVGWIVLIVWLCDGWYDKITKPWKRTLFLFLCGPTGWVGAGYIFIMYILKITKVSAYIVKFFTNGQEKA